MNETCAKCGSDQVIPNLSLLDHWGQAGGAAGPAAVEVAANPSAWLTRSQGKATGHVGLRVCCACGVAEVRVSNGHELWEAYQKAVGRG